MAEALEALLQEGRTFPPPEQFRKDALDHRRVGLRRGRARLAGPLGRAGARARLDRGVAHDPRVGPAVREVVRRRQAQRRVQLPRPPRRGRPRRPGRVPLGGRARRHARGHLRELLDESSRVANLLQVARRRKGRPRRDLHGHGARAARRRDARVRAHRRAALRRVRRLHRRSRCATASTTPRPRCSSPPTARGGAARSSR